MDLELILAHDGDRHRHRGSARRRQSDRHSRRPCARASPAALLAASGSILGDAAFAAAIAFGIREIGDLIVRYGLLLQIAGGVLLLVMGVETFRTHVADKALKLDGPHAQSACGARR